LTPRRLIPLALALFLVGSAPARDLHVNNVRGDDSREGLSPATALATVEKAIQLATPGDTIHLTPTEQPYREQILLKDKGGEPGRPITLDGHGIFLDGSEPAGPWEKTGERLWVMRGEGSRGALVVDKRLVLERKLAPDLEPGQFCFENTQFDQGVLFFKPPAGKEVADCRISAVLADGRTVETDPAKWRVGSLISYKLGPKSAPVRILLDGAEAPLLAARDHLKPGEWCLAEGSVHYYPPAGRTPPDMPIRRLVRGTGITLTGKMAHVVVKNFNVRYVWNDAYNIHGQVTGAAFYNCNAYDCFDEGFSSHDDCETLLDGAVFERCDNGVFNVNKSGGSETRNLTVRQSRHYGYGAAIPDSAARHTLSNAVLEDNPTPLFARYLEAENVRIVTTGAAKPEIALTGPVRLNRATVEGPFTLLLSPGSGPIDLQNTVFRAPGILAFEKPATLRQENVFWSPGTELMRKRNTKPLLLDTALAIPEDTLGTKGGGLLEPGAAVPPGIGWSEKR
jgi:hypothetical protein